jgi:hypothetical protein
LKQLGQALSVRADVVERIAALDVLQDLFG